jgi:hypothetical protein
MLHITWRNKKKDTVPDDYVEDDHEKCTKASDNEQNIKQGETQVQNSNPASKTSQNSQKYGLRNRTQRKYESLYPDDEFVVSEDE